MHHNTKSILTIAVLIVFMVVIAVFINNLEGEITGAVVKPQCKCMDDVDCNDNDPCTEDICLYKESCEAAVCVNTKIADCE